MSFRDIYSNEVLESRRTRSQRARFWGKIVSILLMLTVAVTLRTEPQLRGALISAAMAGAMHVTGRSVPASSPDVPVAFAAPPHSSPEPVGNTKIRDRIKVNRPGSSSAPVHAPARVDVQSLMPEVQENPRAYRANGG
ncbi:MAG: hypothetical protein WA782_03035 [Sulfitobacter sp.]